MDSQTDSCRVSEFCLIRSVDWLATSSFWVVVPEVLLRSLDISETADVLRLGVAPDVATLQSVVADHALSETDLALEDDLFLSTKSDDLNDYWL